MNKSFHRNAAFSNAEYREARRDYVPTRDVKKIGPSQHGSGAKPVAKPPTGAQSRPKSASIRVQASRRPRSSSATPTLPSVATPSPSAPPNIKTWRWDTETSDKLFNRFTSHLHYFNPYPKVAIGGQRAVKIAECTFCGRPVHGNGGHNVDLNEGASTMAPSTSVKTQRSSATSRPRARRRLKITAMMSSDSQSRRGSGDTTHLKHTPPVASPTVKFKPPSATSDTGAPATTSGVEDSTSALHNAGSGVTWRGPPILGKEFGLDLSAAHGHWYSTNFENESTVQGIGLGRIPSSTRRDLKSLPDYTALPNSAFDFNGSHPIQLMSPQLSRVLSELGGLDLGPTFRRSSTSSVSISGVRIQKRPPSAGRSSSKFASSQTLTTGSNPSSSWSSHTSLACSSTSGSKGVGSCGRTFGPVLSKPRWSNPKLDSNVLEITGRSFGR